MNASHSAAPHTTTPHWHVTVRWQAQTLGGMCLPVQARLCLAYEAVAVVEGVLVITGAALRDGTGPFRRAFAPAEWDRLAEAPAHGEDA